MSTEKQWQCCPKCDGEGQILDTGFGVTSVLQYRICPVCNGLKVLNIQTGLPPMLIGQSFANDFTVDINAKTTA